MKIRLYHFPQFKRVPACSRWGVQKI